MCGKPGKNSTRGTRGLRILFLYRGLRGWTRTRGGFGWFGLAGNYLIMLSGGEVVLWMCLADLNVSFDSISGLFSCWVAVSMFLYSRCCQIQCEIVGCECGMKLDSSVGIPPGYLMCSTAEFGSFLLYCLGCRFEEWACLGSGCLLSLVSCAGLVQPSEKV